MHNIEIKLRDLFLFGAMLLVLSFNVASAQIHDEWTSIFDSTIIGTSGVGNDVVVDESGNIYATGSAVLDAGRGIDCVTLKYGPDGQLSWYRYYDSPVHQSEEGNYIKLDRDLNIVVGGISRNGNDISGFILAKYSSDGEQQWVSAYPLPASSEIEFSGIGVDYNNNIYLTGAVPGSTGLGDFDYITIKYNSNGELQWDVRYLGDTDASTRAMAIAVDADGNSYVTGFTHGTDGRPKIATIKYNTSGQQQWLAMFQNPDTYSSMGHCITLDSQGNVYIAGGLGLYEEICNYQTLKYNIDGELQWSDVYNPNFRLDGELISSPVAIAIDAAGNTLITGSGWMGIREVYNTIKYNTGGELQWFSLYDGLPSGFSIASDIAVDSQGNSYITGGSDNSNLYNYDIATLRYDNSGRQEWVQRFNGPTNGDDNGEAIAIDNQNNIIVTGSCGDRINHGSKIVVVKYSQSQTSIVDDAHDVPSLMQLNPAYPNPFNSSTMLSFFNPGGNEMLIEIFNITGQRIRTFETTNSISGSVYWNAQDDYGSNIASGVYYARAKSGDKSSTVKLVYLK